MKFQKLKQAVYEANLLLHQYNLVIHTWGNVSGLSEDGKHFAIKPSGVSYQTLKVDDIVVLNLQGEVVEGKLKPSSDTPTHLYLYQKWPELKGIVHTHSPYAVAWASVGESIPCYSTTHADYFRGSILCTGFFEEKEADSDYELNTGKKIVEVFDGWNKNPQENPAVLVRSHGPFVWSYQGPQKAVDLALTLEEVAKIAYFTKTLNPEQSEASRIIQKKHYSRKHGVNKYYGQ